MIRSRALGRVVQVVPTILGVLLVGFLLVQGAPGDPVLALAGDSGDAAYYEDMRERFALDRPLIQQLSAFIYRMARGDLGQSYVQGRPASSVIAERVPATLLLMSSALVVSTLLGGALGIARALWGERGRGRWLDVMTLALYAAPTFFVAQIALLLFALAFPVFPVFGIRDPGGGPGGILGAVDVLHHLFLPTMVLASAQLAGIARVTGSALSTELQQIYVRTARAKGLATPAVVRHALRISLLPVVTLVGNRVGQLLGGAVIVEAMFGWPGLGTLLLDATRNRDAPVVLGIFLGVTVTVVLANLVTDLLYSALDPRVGPDARWRTVGRAQTPPAAERTI